MDFRGKLAEFYVIGVVKDVRSANLTRLDPAHVYLTPEAGKFLPAIVRLRGEQAAARAAIRAAVQSFDPALAPSENLTNMRDGPVWMQKILAQVLAVTTLTLAGLALLLAGVGIHGVMAFLVSQRTREIGIRMALGAAAGDVVRGIVADGLRPVIVGIILGIGGAAGASAVVHSTLRFPGSMDFLYGVSFYDPATFGGRAAFVIGVAALASSVPARRAARVDPAVALRWE
jgi:ABC-type antimicrobial peptide transport system permease subunit